MIFNLDQTFDNNEKVCSADNHVLCIISMLLHMFLCVLVRPGFGLKKRRSSRHAEKKMVVGGGVALQ